MNEKFEYYVNIIMKLYYLKYYTHVCKCISIFITKIKVIDNLI